MAEVTIQGQVYRTGKLNAFQQFHVARRLAPILQSISNVATKLPEPSSAQLGENDTVALLDGLTNVVSRMSDEDCNYVLNACLGACSRQQGAGWARVQAANGGGLMFVDIDMNVMLQLAFATVRENITNFFPVAPAADSSSGASPT